MLGYLGRRIALAIPTLLGVATIVFLMVRLLPGDPARVIAGVHASPEDVRAIRESLGLDEPLLSQYVSFMASLAGGDLGVSARTGESVAAEVMTRIPATVQLAVLSTLVASVLGIAAGTLAAMRPNSPLDVLLSAATVFGMSMPVYWLGLMLIVLFSVNLGWLPAGGRDDPLSFVLPTVTLAAFSVALIARMARSSMLEVLGADYIRTARAKGASRLRVVLHHAMRNAMLPVITVIGLQLGLLLGGAVLTETIFSWPGMGQLLVQAILARDYPLVQGILLVFAASVIVVNLLVDLAYAYVDPRVRLG